MLPKLFCRCRRQSTSTQLHRWRRRNCRMANKRENNRYRNKLTCSSFANRMLSLSSLPLRTVQIEKLLRKRHKQRPVEHRQERAQTFWWVRTVGRTQRAVVRGVWSLNSWLRVLVITHSMGWESTHDAYRSFQLEINGDIRVVRLKYGHGIDIRSGGAQTGKMAILGGWS